MATEKWLIDAYELMEHLDKCIATTNRNDRAVCLCIKCFVDLMPIVDAVEVVHAQWKPYFDYFTERQVGWICSNCSGVQDDVSNGDTNFCPECGAIMDGDWNG